MRSLHPASIRLGYSVFTFFAAQVGSKGGIFILKKSIKLFGSVKTLCAAAILCALTTIIAFICKSFTVGPFLRVTFENLPIIFSGWVFGPLVGLAVGICADLISALVVYGGGWLPGITLGAGCVGLLAGLISRYIPMKNEFIKLALAVLIPHIVGNMIIKSATFMISYGTPVIQLMLRVPLYLVIATAEYFLLLAITNNTTIKRMTSK